MTDTPSLDTKLAEVIDKLQSLSPDAVRLATEAIHASAVVQTAVTLVAIAIMCPVACVLFRLGNRYLRQYSSWRDAPAGLESDELRKFRDHDNNAAACHIAAGVLGLLSMFPLATLLSTKLWLALTHPDLALAKRIMDAVLEQSK